MVSPLSIVNVAVAIQVAEQPNELQQTGALVSQGATSLAPQATTFLTQLSDLTAFLKGAAAIQSLAWNAQVVTVTTQSPHGLTIADTLPVTISGCIPTGYNGTFTATVTGASTFTYPLTTNPGTATTLGAWTAEDVAELVAMATTFFAQGNSLGVFVIELGPGNATDGVTALQTQIASTPNLFYRYLIPRYWDANSSFIAFLNTQTAPTTQRYFHITTTSANFAQYAGMKCAVTMIEAPNLPAIEFSAASLMYVVLNYSPSLASQVPPTAYSFVFGVTPYPTAGQNSFLTQVKAAGCNIIGTGAQGGISNTIVFWGTTADSNDITFWYSVDWVQIHVTEDLANAVINGSNNPQAPLYYNQQGINRLQKVAQQTMNNAISFGLANSPVTVGAVPFAVYVAAQPSDYPKGIYNGISITYTPARGFLNITVNVTVDEIPAP